MYVAQKVREYLEEQDIQYELVHHPYSEGSIQSAIAARVPLGKMAKAIVLEDHEGRHLMAVIPAANKLELKRLGELVERSLKLVREQTLFDLFDDCCYGAVPVVGSAYNMETVYDDQLNEVDDLYFEAGNHEDLLHIKRAQFTDLVIGNQHGDFSVAIASPYDHHGGGVITY